MLATSECIRDVISGVASKPGFQKQSRARSINTFIPLMTCAIIYRIHRVSTCYTVKLTSQLLVDISGYRLNSVCLQLADLLPRLSIHILEHSCQR